MCYTVQNAKAISEMKLELFLTRRFSVIAGAPVMASAFSDG